MISFISILINVNTISIMKKKEIATSRIPVTPETQHRLKIFAVKKSLTFDKAINYLLDKIEK